ncbi:MAG: MurT ligase domain-containing protein, partial [Candidatus Levyibacteriota bacterium]
GRSGSTWPGHAALSLDKDIAKKLARKNPNLKIILVAGTNGKTTTSKMISEVLEKHGLRVFSNQEGANLLNGIASSLISHSSIFGKINYDVAIFEADENSLPAIAHSTKPYAIILLNLFRDQLDRYGEVNIIASKWKKTIEKLPKETLLISNGDDPMLSFISAKSGLNSFHFGLPKDKASNSKQTSDVDFLYCPSCQTKLEFENITYSHLGKFKCPKCKFTNPLIYSFDTLPNPLLGEYNRYNINAAALLLTEGFNVGLEQIEMSLKNFSPAFGRQENIKYKNKNVFVMLSKNPASFNQSITAVLSKEKAPNILLLLNDAVPDGRDVSWIWDIDTEELVRSSKNIMISGDRCYDMALRLKYAGSGEQRAKGEWLIEENLEKAIDKAILRLPKDKTLYVLATYSAMLEARKILTGKKIL